MPQWIKFELIERPTYDKNGNLLNRPLYTDRYGLKEIYGGGKVYPDIPSDKIKERHEKDGIWLLKVDILESEAIAIKIKDETKKYKASPKIEKEYNANKDFKALLLTDQEAEDLKTNFFGIKKLIVDSGVTP
ncbi:MAG: hypothetical protein ABIL06_16250 [Pseudomonadota bacterium]